MTHTAVRREALLSAGAAAAVAALLAWLGPPGSDLAAHAYQRTLFLHHGFALWNNFWYAGRYSFVTYSVLYYPLAALLGIRLLGVATIATAAYAFAVVLWREWGATARWSSRTFAVVWAGIVLSAAFPFALGAALVLLALWALQARAHWRFALLALLTLAASPVAFLLLVVVAAGIALSRRRPLGQLAGPALAIVATGAIEVVLTRLFPDAGRFPFSFAELAAALTFCCIGAAMTWRVERARALRTFFVVYAAACVVAYLVPSGVGENIARMRFAAIPVAVLALSLRNWRPWPAAAVALGLAISWNATPFVSPIARAESSPDAQAAYWTPAVRFLHSHLTPDYRVEAVDTAGHWPAAFLARAGIPLARGWFRQDDFPQNQVLYSKLGRRAYLGWVHSLGIRYVVLTTATLDYSARAEAALLRSGRSGLVPAFRTPTTTIYEVPDVRPILTGPSRARVLALTQARVEVALAARGTYRLAVRWSPYWRPSRGCLRAGKDGMIRVLARTGGRVSLRFAVDASGAIEAVTGQKKVCAR